MQVRNTLLSPVSILAAGFALGLGTASYFAASDNEGINPRIAIGLSTANSVAAADNEGKNTTSIASTTLPKTTVNLEAIEKANTNVLPTALTAPAKLAASTEPPLQEARVVSSMLSEDITLSETVDTNRQEIAIAEPSPEELAYSPLVDAVTPLYSAYETDELESKLRLESEKPVQLHLDGVVGLLENEAL